MSFRVTYASYEELESAHIRSGLVPKRVCDYCIAGLPDSPYAVTHKQEVAAGYEDTATAGGVPLTWRKNYRHLSWQQTDRCRVTSDDASPLRDVVIGI